MAESKQYFGKLIGTRPTWPDDMTPDEEKIMQEHFVYLKNLVAEEKVILAGPCLEGKFGIVIIQATTREEAEKIMAGDPSVTSGLHIYELLEMRVSLLM
jgi:uncharacterized protein YciI